MTTTDPLETFQPDPFRPAWWLPGGHLQTLGARLLRQPVSYSFERETIRTPDDDFLALDYDRTRESFHQNNRGHVLLLHGLEGCARSSYILTTARILRQAGYAVVALNFRSCSGSPNRRPRFYHSGETGDLRFVVDYLTERIGDDLTGIVGFSLGGNVLLKYLGEADQSPPVNRAVAVSVPFDLSAGADRLQNGLSHLYELYFLRQLKQKLRQKERIYHHGLDVDKLDTVWTLRAFDNDFTAPIHGFDSADDYYTQSSSRYYIGKIETPTLILHARNDPMVPADSIPIDKFEANQSINHHVTDGGGHVGFVQGRVPWRYSFWAEATLADFLTS